MREEIFDTNRSMAAPADYFGQGRTQLASVTRTADGAILLWNIHNDDGSIQSLRFGASGDTALSNCRFAGPAAATLAVLRKGVNGHQLRYIVPGESKARKLRLTSFKEIYRASCGDIAGKGADALIIHAAQESRGLRQDVLAAVDPLTRKVIFKRKLKRGAARAILAADLNGNGASVIGVLKRPLNGSQIIEFYLSPVSTVPVVIEPVREITAAILQTSLNRQCGGLMYRTVTNQLKGINFCELLPQPLMDINNLQNSGKIRLVPSVNFKSFPLRK